MFYPLQIIHNPSGSVIGACRDIPECVFMAKDAADALKQAPIQIPGSLELHYRRKRRPYPLPTALQKGETPIFVPIRIQTKILLWNELCKRGIRLSEFARDLKINPAQAQRLVNLTQDLVRIDVIEEALATLGCTLDAVLITDK